MDARLQAMLRRSPTSDEFAALVRSRPSLEIRIAIRSVQTVAGAERIYAAEAAGRRRPALMRAAECRIAELRGEPATLEPIGVAFIAKG